MNIIPILIFDTIELIYLNLKLFFFGGVQGIWDKKPDADILTAYDDATGWIDLSLGIFESETTIEIAEDCFKRLDLYILPQMRKRRLFND